MNSLLVTVLIFNVIVVAGFAVLGVLSGKERITNKTSSKERKKSEHWFMAIIRWACKKVLCVAYKSQQKKVRWYLWEELSGQPTYLR